MRSDKAERSPSAFAWDDWYATVGGRSIRIPEVTDLLQESMQELLDAAAT